MASITYTNNNQILESENCKKIVLYGLEEYPEYETDLYNRVISVFRNILEVDLTGYIEELSRLGRKGYKRPLVIEIISKRMTKYILQNKHYFRNTGLAISEYLCRDEMESRRKLRDQQMGNRNERQSTTFNTLQRTRQTLSQSNPSRIERTSTGAPLPTPYKNNTFRQ